MTEDEVRAAAERLVEFHERFAPLFGKEQAQDHAYTYVKGLMVCPERKSIEPIALNVGDGQVSALQKFINIAPWDHGDVQAEIQAVFADELVPTAAGSPIGDGRGGRRERLRQEGRSQRRRGPAAQRPAGQGGQLPGRRLPRGRHPRRLGAAGPSALPARGVGAKTTEACRGPPRRRSTSPRRSPSRPSPQIAAGLIRQTAALGVVALDWITADEEYGRNGEFLDEVERLELRYVVEVPVNTTVWTEDPAVVRPAVRRPGPGADAAEPGVGRLGGRGRRRAWAARRGRPCRSARGRRGRWPSSSPRSGSGRCVTAWPGRRSGCWCGGVWSRRPRSSTTSATPTPRRRWGCWRRWPARGTRSRRAKQTTPQATGGAAAPGAGYHRRHRAARTGRVVPRPPDRHHPEGSHAHRRTTHRSPPRLTPTPPAPAPRRRSGPGSPPTEAAAPRPARQAARPAPRGHAPRGGRP